METSVENIAEEQQSKLAGADDIYLTDCSIVIRRVNDHADTKTYYPKTVKNMQELYKIYGEMRYGE